MIYQHPMHAGGRNALHATESGIRSTLSELPGLEAHLTFFMF